MAKTTIYHNPRCSTSRRTLAILKERGVDLDVVRYLEDPPSAAELDSLCRKLGIEPVRLMRTKEKRFAELGLSVKDDRPRKEWLTLMAENPILIERPVVVRRGKAAIGRPPESGLEIL
jgi:arsenate reductase